MRHIDEEREPLLPGLERLQADLVRAAERRVAARPRHQRVGRPIFAFAAASLVIACAVAAFLLIGSAEPGAPRDARLAVVTHGATARNLPPAGRLFASADGSQCVVAGRVDARQLAGLTDHPLTALPSAACRTKPHRALVASQGLTSLAVLTSRGEKKVRVGAGRAFLLVVGGSR